VNFLRRTTLPNDQTGILTLALGPNPYFLTFPFAKPLTDDYFYNKKRESETK